VKRRVYGYMRAYDDRSDDEIRCDELELARWAESEGYELVCVYQELDEGGNAELTALVAELKRTKTRAVVVPSIAHFGAGRALQDHVWAHIVHNGGAEVYEVGSR